MNIVIPYRYVETPELKYALRSIEKYLTGYDRVFIVGDYIPKWLRNIEFIYCSEESVKCAKNIINKLVVASNHPSVGSTFTQWQDDLFIQEPLDIEDIEHWYNGTLESHLDKSFGRYHKIILNTALKLGGQARFYDIHTPIIYNAHRLRQIAPIWNEKDYLIKSMYCAGLAGEKMEDCKIDIGETKQSMLEKISGKLFFTLMSEFEPVMEEVLNELYPEKSKYEK